MSNRILILVTVIASIAIVALGAVIGILPKVAEIGVNALNLASVQAQNEGYSAELEALKTQYENIGDVRDALAELRTTLPADGDYAGFTAEIDSIAARTGVRVMELSQTAPLIYGATAEEGTDTGTAAAPISGGTLLAIPYKIIVDSPDPNFILAFMDGIRLGERLLLITDFTYEVSEENSSKVYTVTISAFAYTMVDPSAIPATPDDGVPTAPVPTPEPTPTEGANP